jgi:hypothetical protein
MTRWCLIVAAAVCAPAGCKKSSDEAGRKLDEKIERLGGLERATPDPAAKVPAPVPTRECYDAPPLEANGVEVAGQLRWADDLPEPRANARVLAFAVDGGALVARAVADADGRFVLRAPAVRVRVQVCHRGARNTVSAEHYGDLDDVDLAKVTSLAPRLFPEGLVGGEVKRADGTRAGGVEVHVQSLVELDAPPTVVVTDADGRFAVGGLGWDLVAVRARTATEAGALRGQDPRGEPLVGTITLAPAGPVDVRVGGGECPGTIVYLSYHSPELLDVGIATLGEDRLAHFPAMVPGKYRVDLGCEPVLQRFIEVRAGERQTFTCQPGSPTCVAD